MNKTKSIVLCGGGTAGHIIPNIALLPELKKHFTKITYLGESNSMEEEIAKQHNLDFVPIKCVKFNRESLVKNIKIPFVLKSYINDCKKVLRTLSPSIVFSKGGYVSLPVVLASKKLNIPYCIHESDSSIGLANKLVAKNAKFVFTNFKNTFSAPNVLNVGIPLREDLFSSRSRESILSELGLENRKTILVTGGSSGAKNINEVVYSLAPSITKRYNLIHLTGKNKSKKVLANGYLQMEFSNDMGKLYKVSDVVVSRAGATTIAELNALNKKAILIPLSKSASRGDQIKNAEQMIGSPTYAVIDDDALNVDNLKTTIDGLILTPNVKENSKENPSVIISKILSLI